jgi:predicted amidohydrolase
MSHTFAIAGVQMHVSAIHSNVPMMKQKLDIIMSGYLWIQMVVFSELSAFGSVSQNKILIPNHIEEKFKAMTKKHGAWPIPGTMFTHREDNIYNTAMVINPHGELVGRYDKMFPFFPYEEGVTAGNHFMTFDVPKVGKFGLSICYDMWFPETSRTLAVQGVKVIIHPTLTGTIDRDIELVNVQATAAIHECFVVKINGLCGGGNKRSIVCGPDGRVLYQASAAEERNPVELDIDRVRRSREFGVLRLSQPLKSFMDNKVLFEEYRNNEEMPYLNTLSELKKYSKATLS